MKNHLHNESDTPFLMRIFHFAIPGRMDVGALVMSTLSFGLMLALLFRVCVTYYDDVQLGQQAIVLITLLPLSYFFSAPMSESIYLAAVLGMFLASTSKNWWLVGLTGFMAVLARNQGVALFGVGILLILERQPNVLPFPLHVQRVIKKSVPLLLIVLGYILFILFRAIKGLPSLLETYHKYSYHFFTDPLSSLVYNAQFFWGNFPQTLLNVDIWAFLFSIGLAVWSLRFATHRKLPLLAYTFGYLMLFISKVNWVYGTYIISNSGSIARYSLTLFPLTIFIADRVRYMEKAKRLIIFATLIFFLLLFSALHVLFIGPH